MTGINYFSKLSYLMIETNSDCNLSCSFCNRDLLVSKGTRKPFHISEKEFHKMLEVFKHCPIDTIKLEGISEPTLHPNFPRLTEILRDTFPNAFVIIATNMQTRYKDIDFNRILSNVDMVYLSISGTEQLYEEIHTQGLWKRVRSNLEHIEAIVPESIRKKKLFLNFTATNYNFNSLPKLYKIKDEFSLARVRINLAQNWSEDEMNSNHFTHECLEYLQKYRHDIMGVGDWGYKDCFWPFNGIVVDVFGNVRQCIINNTQTPIANIWQDNLPETYNNSKHYQQTRATLQNNIPTKSCSTCDYKFLSPILFQLLKKQSIQNTSRSFSKPIGNINPFPGTTSGSTFEIINSNSSKQIMLKKSHTTDKVRILKEYNWLKAHSHFQSIPAPTSYVENGTGASYQRPYFYDYQDLSTVLNEDITPKEITSIITKILNTISQIHSNSWIKTSHQQITRYLDNKFVDKIDHAKQSSTSIENLSAHSTIVINNESCHGLKWIRENLYSSSIINILMNDSNSDLHGDLTAENILVGPQSQIILIDPNDGNTISSPYIDYAKLLQSFHSNYESIAQISDMKINSNQISFSLPHNQNYAIARSTVENFIDDNFPPFAKILIQFHEAINFARMIPYQIKARPKIAPVYFSVMIKLFNRFLKNEF